MSGDPGRVTDRSWGLPRLKEASPSLAADVFYDPRAASRPVYNRALQGGIVRRRPFRTDHLGSMRSRRPRFMARHPSLEHSTIGALFAGGLSLAQKGVNASRPASLVGTGRS